ncbi:MAG: hypothetical protein KBT21_09805 [Treponema sp.]|nr:hypothetical protein [Candidatus Treponema merdequi]
MVQREVLKLISYADSKKDSYLETYNSYQNQISVFEKNKHYADQLYSSYANNPSYGKNGNVNTDYENYKKRAEEIAFYRTQLSYLWDQKNIWDSNRSQLYSFLVTLQNLKSNEFDKIQLQIKNIKSFIDEKGIPTSIFTGAYKGLWSVDDAISGSSEDLSYWADELERSTRAANEASVELYKKAGYTLTDSGMNELENQYLKASALEQYWKEQLEIAEAVKNYAVNRTSTQEVLYETKKNLVLAIDEYNAANDAYQATLDLLDELSKDCDAGADKINKEKEKLTKEQLVLEQKQKEYNEALAAYNDLYGSAVEKSINAIIDKLNLEQTSEEDKEQQLKEYYEALAKKVSSSVSVKKNNIILNLENGIKNNAKFESSLDYFAESELSEYSQLSSSDVLDLTFDFSQLELKLSGICKTEVETIKAALELINNSTTDEAIKEGCKVYIESAVLSINKIFTKEQQKRTLIKKYLNNEDIDSTAAAFTPADNVYAFVKTYFSIFNKAGLNERFSEDEVIELTEINKKSGELSRQEFYEYMSDERNNPLVIRMLNLSDLTPEYVALFESAYDLNLYEGGAESAELVSQIKDTYSEYLVSNINIASSKAKENVSHVINTNNIANMNKEEILDYAAKLNIASEGIDDVGVSALNLYVSEILYNYAYENDVQVNKNSVEKRIEDLSLQISEIINWGTYVKNASTIKKILSSKLFESLDASSDVKKEIIRQAALLFLPNISDLSSLSTIKNDAFFMITQQETAYDVVDQDDGQSSEIRQISENVKNEIAKAIEKLSKIYPEYESNVTEQNLINFQKLQTLTLKYFENKNDIQIFNKAIEVLQNQYDVLMKGQEPDEEICNGLKNQIEELNTKIAESEEAFENFVKDDSYYTEIYPSINFDMTVNDWYLPSLISRDFLYEVLCENLFDAAGNLDLNGFARINAVNTYLEANSEEKFADLERFVQTFVYINSYNKFFDGDVNDWIDSLNIEDDFKEQLSNYFNYGWLVYPDYFAETMQNNYNACADKYYIDLEYTQNNLLEDLEALYDVNYKNYLIANYEKELASYLDKKTGEKFTSEAAWVEATNKTIETNNENLPFDKKVQKLSISVGNIKKENNYASAFEKFFTSPSETFNVTESTVSNSDDTQISEAYAKIFDERNARVNNIAVLKEEFVLLKDMFGESAEKQQKVNETFEAYQIQQNITDSQKKSYYDSLDEYQEECRLYNNQMKVVQAAYNVLETNRIEKRKADEIKRWADNEYLHDYKGYYNTEEYVTPEEKYDAVSEAYTKAKLALEIITDVKENKEATVEKEYDKEYKEYTASFDKYFRAILLKAEISQAIAKQEEKLQQAEFNVEKARIELIKSCKNEPPLSDIAKKYVVATKNGENNYSFEIKGYTSNESQLETYYNDETICLYIDEHENEYRVDLAQHDAFSWLLTMESYGGDYLEDLVLAAYYLLANNNDGSAIADMKDNGIKDANAASIIISLHGMNSRPIYDRAISDYITNAYQNVMSDKSKRENLAKFLLFKDTYLVEQNENLILRAHNVLCRRAYEPVKYEAKLEENKNIAISVSYGIVAAGFYALAASIWNAWALIPAAAASVACACYAATAHDFSEYISEMSNAQSACNRNISSYEQKVSSLVKNYNDAEAKRVEERQRLNLMKYGSKDGRLDVLDYDSFNAAITESLKDSELKDENDNFVLNADYIKEIYDINDDSKKNLSSYYYVVNKNGTELTTVSDVLTKLVSNLDTVSKDKDVALKEKVALLSLKQSNDAEAFNSAVSEYIADKTVYTKDELEKLAKAAWGNNSWNEIAFQNRMQSFYNQYLDTKYISNKRATESYITDVIARLNESYALELMKEEELCYDARNYKNILVYQNFENEFDQVEQQIDQIVVVADSEWIKAEQKLNSSHNTWLTEFDNQLKEKRNSWDNNYSSFLTEKAEWITTQYVYANNVSSIDSLSNSGADIGKVLQESLSGLDSINVNNEVLNSIKSDLNGYVSSLYNDNLLINLFDMAAIAKTSTQSLAPRLLSSNEKNVGTMESYFAAIKVQNEITSQLKDNAARLAAEQAETQIMKMVEAYMNRIDSENKAMLDWEESLVRSVGYEFGSTIKRDAITDSTFFATERETQYVHVYQNFVTAKPNVPLTINSNDSSTTIMSKIYNAQSLLDEWSERIFGRTDTDENGNKTIKYYYVPRNIADLNNVSEYEKNTIAQKDIGDRTDIVSIRDGEFGQHLGYAPEWVESKDIKIKDGREANLKSKQIHGEIGLIMLDYQWNEMVRNNGMAMFSLPVYDKKLWPDGGIFEAPSLRSICSVVCDIAGTLTGQSWWLGLVDDALFATLDLSIEKKDPGQVALGFAKAAAVNSLGAGLGAAGKGLTAAAGGITNAALRIGTQAAIGAATSYLTSAGAGFINAINYDPSNGWSYDIDSAVDNLKSSSTIAGAVGAGVTAGLNGYFAADGNGIALNGKTFDTNSITRLNGFIGGLASNATSLIMGGDATFNLASIYGQGFLEFSFGQDGVKARFGTGGANISLSSLKTYSQGVKEASKVSEWKNGGNEKLATLNAINMASYADTNLSLEIARQIWNEKLGVEYADLNNAYGNYTPGDSKIVLNNNLLGNSRDDSAKLAAVMAHEGTHYLGVANEGYAHTMAFDTYQGIRNNLKLKGDDEFAEDIKQNMLSEQNWNTENSGETQWWLYKLDGTIVDNNVLDKDGNWEDYRQVINEEGYMIDFVDGKYIMIDEKGKKVRNATEKDKEYARIKTQYKDENDKVHTEYSKYKGSRSIQLLREIGEENVKKMIGYEIDSCYDVPIEVLASATGMSIESLQYHLKSGCTTITNAIFAANREAIIAEGMLNALDSHWNKDKGVWTNSSKLKIPGLKEDEELGVKMNLAKDDKGNIVKSYEYFTAGFDLVRDEDAYNVWVDGVDYVNRQTYVGEDGKNHPVTDQMRYDTYANTTVSMWIRNLFTDTTLTYESPTMWDSVSNHADDTTRVTVDGHEYKGNTVVSPTFKMHMIDGGATWGMTTLGVITDATTLAGQTIHKGGALSIGSYSDRWLFHSMCAVSGGSAGCEGAVSDLGTPTGKWKDPDYAGSGASYMKQIWDQLKDTWGIYNGYEFKVSLAGQVRP